VDEYKSRLSAYLSDMVREELEKYDGGFTDEWNDQRKKNAEVLGYKLSGTSDIKETKKKDSRGTERDYKKEYAKYGSSTKSKKYRAELNKYNRKKGTYGNGDGKDASHKGGKIVGFESESKNRGRAEKSRLKKESVNEGQKRFRIGHNIGRAKYVISFHNGKSKHTDGSDFWDLQIHKNKKSLEKGKEDLRQKGYFEESVNGATKSRLKKETVSRNTLRKIIREELQSVNEGLSGSILTKVKKNSKDVYGRTDYTADGNQMSYYSGNNKYYIVFHGKKGEVTKYIDMPGNVNKHDKAEKFFKDFIKKYDRTKKLESVNEAKIAHSKGGYVEVGKWYLLNYGKWKDTVKVVSIDAKGMKVYNPNDNWRYTIPMTMIKKKKIGGYMTPIDESINEAKRYKLGDSWSKDFDYEGMLKWGMSVDWRMDEERLLLLHHSLEDVNYHNIATPLWDAMVALKTDNKSKAKSLLKKVNKLSKHEMSESINETKLTEDYKNSEWEVYVADENGKEKIVKKAKSKRAGVILYNKLINSDKYHEVGMRVVKESVNEANASTIKKKLLKQYGGVVIMKITKSQLREMIREEIQKLNESSLDYEQDFKWANENELKVISKLIWMNPQGIAGVIKMGKKKPAEFKKLIKQMAKKGLGESINEGGTGKLGKDESDDIRRYRIYQ